MPEINREGYTVEERKRHDAVYERLSEYIYYQHDEAKFRRALKSALAKGFYVDFTDADGLTLLLCATRRHSYEAMSTGIPQMLLEAGADINAKDREGETPIDGACQCFVQYGDDIPLREKMVEAIDALLAGRQNAAGTRNALRNSPNAPAGRGRSVAGARPDYQKAA